jgi:hypothetical protein
VKDERLVVLDRDQLGQVLIGLFDVNKGLRVVAKDAELAAEAQVNAGRLQVALFPRFDNQGTGCNLFLDRAVRQNGRGETPGACLEESSRGGRNE